MGSVTLARGAVGVRELLFQSVAFMGCGATIVSSLPLTMAYAGGAAIVSGILCLLALLTVALSIGALARHLPTAGSFSTYAAQAIHPAAGFLVGWAYALLALLTEPLLALVLAATLAATSPFPHALWWLYALAAIGIVSAFGYLSIRTSALANVVLGIFELTVFAVLSVWLIFSAGHRNTVAVFSTRFADIPHHTGFGGVIVGMIFTVLAFGGFEAAAPLAEEARTPRRTIGRAVLVALLLVAAVELLSIYAATVYYGPSKMGQFSRIGGGLGANWELLATKVWGVGWVLVLIAVLNSCLANANAGANTATRTIYAFGRIRILPPMTAAVHPRSRSPYVAVTIQVALAALVTFGLGFRYGTDDAFGIIGTLTGIVFALLYIVINISCIMYLWRRQRDEFTWWRHGLIPVIGILVLLPVFFAGAGLPVFSFITPIAAPFSYAGSAIAAWMIIGLAYLSYLIKRRPERLADMTKVFLADQLPDPGEQPEGDAGARPVGEGGAEVIGQGLGVVLPDRLVEARDGQGDVTGGPHRGAERHAVNGVRPARRPGQDAVDRGLPRPVAPVHGGADRPRPAVRERPLGEALDQPLADLPGVGGFVPAVDRGEFPRQRAVLAATATVPHVPDRIHADGPHGPGRQAGHDGPERRQWLFPDAHVKLRSLPRREPGQGGRDQGFGPRAQGGLQRGKEFR
jgi:amino acid transporter